MHLLLGSDILVALSLSLQSSPFMFRLISMTASVASLVSPSTMMATFGLGTPERIFVLPASITTPIPADLGYYVTNDFDRHRLLRLSGVIKDVGPYLPNRSTLTPTDLLFEISHTANLKNGSNLSALYRTEQPLGQIPCQQPNSKLRRLPCNHRAVSRFVCLG